MKLLIVNADDLGASRGINCGVFEAHRNGILTSASLLVNTRWSEEAANMSQGMSGLSVGLHADLADDLQRWPNASRLRSSLDSQLERFQQLLGCLPSHLDSQYNVHRDARALPVFLDFAGQYHLPLREHSSVRHFPKFYGQSGGQTHFQRISAQNLAKMLRSEIEEGVTELTCHPGYVDRDLHMGYTIEREAELRSLCSPEVRETIAEQGIELISYHDLRKLLVPIAG